MFIFVLYFIEKKKRLLSFFFFFYKVWFKFLATVFRSFTFLDPSRCLYHWGKWSGLRGKCSRSGLRCSISSCRSSLRASSLDRNQLSTSSRLFCVAFSSLARDLQAVTNLLMADRRLLIRPLPHEVPLCIWASLPQVSTLWASCYPFSIATAAIDFRLPHFSKIEFQT